MLIGYDDVSGDNRDIDLYYDNSNCEFRNFRIIGMRTSTNAPRADMEALLAVDRGTPDEQLPDVLNLMNPRHHDLIDQHTDGILDRRARETTIVVTPTT